MTSDSHKSRIQQPACGIAALEDVPESPECSVHVVDLSFETVLHLRVHCDADSGSEVGVSIGTIKKAVSAAKLCGTLQTQSQSKIETF